ncbi:hypothetical protein A2630_00800 [Candidatus Woesebacteria bacterium RIFCSPHIGHO2_01_FULL_44_10]|uniref:YrhK domain-containing protein n=1 Tax=Candidatus Woesebacteria bacterium RIFCSPLOWO2_01_FULL_44_14 TaxID=1802525 RepID=A0A1F8C1J7_9BACT|nr:MAG: hypothetical protein A2630_00800 [Candidatus Woesebacteria bacterium RIFCSPHIGHO2_01_FULL_44_10]OGM54340.1 MAG: hypothetical protein A3F62_01125 [Candidatus Woesebacteria bacterium RIFCSPHIGHO2_12_FULL_44_11]OGM70241.1 MAG: hypothetical protein A2975_04175 [Candidatus Woesebacteria bacterium RIFCSPLOWO2_01_FULL_44_14]
MRLTVHQRRILSEFVANVGVTWFAGGVVAPIFSTRDLQNIITTGIWGLSLSLVSVSFALLINKSS